MKLHFEPNVYCLVRPYPSKDIMHSHISDKANIIPLNVHTSSCC